MIQRVVQKRKAKQKNKDEKDEKSETMCSYPIWIYSLVITESQRVFFFFYSSGFRANLRALRLILGTNLNAHLRGSH